MSTGQHSLSAHSVSSDPSSLFEPYVWAWFSDAFERPSPPQVAGWPKIAEGKHTLMLSPTGSGKTLAAFLWCINELFRMANHRVLDDAVYVLYVSPLKALNNDIQKNLVEPLRGIREYAQRAGIEVPDVRSEVRTGDTPPKIRARMARRPPHILITTPESLFIILATSKFREAFRTVRYVIVDEIHAMSNNKRGVHLSLSLERLQHLVGDQNEFVRIGLSATQRPLEEIAKFLVGMAGTGRPRPCEIIDMGARKDLDVRVVAAVDNLLEAQFDAIWGSAHDKMISMVRGHKTTLIFTNSRYKTERTALRLNELSADGRVAVGAHHGSMSKKVRLEMENQLKQGALDALVATSSLELGIDVGSIDLVCQVQSPKSVSTGMQRIGRAGHLLDATSKGRLLVTDRDDLVESAVLVRAVVEGRIDATRVPTNCLDVLAQQIVGAVAADDWPADDLYNLCRRSYCYRELQREEFDRVLDMLAGDYSFDMEYAPYPKILWDRVNDVLYPERSARMIAFRACGTIPDVADYDVYFEERKTRVGRLGEGFVEELHAGDIFILGSSSWRVLGIQRNRVIVEDVYGQPPTIPFWVGDRASRTHDLGMLVGQFRREMQARIGANTRAGDTIRWLQEDYYVDENGARAIYEYFREQQLVTARLPSDRLVLVENFRDELGQQQIVIHSSFGIRVNDPWAMALGQAIDEAHGFRPRIATVDDGILITLPSDAEAQSLAPLRLVTTENLDELLGRTLLTSPVFLSRFRHNAVRSLMVLREYRGRRTPVWLQSLRASALLEACRDDPDFPVTAETIRECMNEALDVACLRLVLRRLESGEIQARTIETKIPSPFTHSLLLLGQYGEWGSIPTRERRGRLMHLHRELLKQILDEETLRNLLDEETVEDVVSRLQRTHRQRRARNTNELARVLVELGDLVDVADDEISLRDRVDGNAGEMLAELVAAHRAIQVPIPTAETHRERWISTESFSLYRDAFSRPVRPDVTDAYLLQLLAEHGPLSLSEIPASGAIEDRIDRLVAAYRVLRLPERGQDAEERGARYAAVDTWIPRQLLERGMSRDEARLALVRRFARRRGPMTKYDVMEHYGFPDQFAQRALVALYEQGIVTRGEYVPTKSFPQWCYRANLEQIHRLTLNRLRREMEPAMPEEYADFLARWQHVHPDVQLSGLDGLRQVIRQLEGQENFQAVWERDVFPSRVRDYRPAMLDRLCYSGEVCWRRFGYKNLRRGQIGICLREDHDWLVVNPTQVEMALNRWDDDIPEVCDAVRGALAKRGACFFDELVRDTALDWRLVLRAVWHLVWTGEATNDSFESIRHASFTSGLSGCYDLFKKPGRKGVTLDYIVKHMLEYRKLDPRLGRWAPTERVMPSRLSAPEEADRIRRWADLLLKRHGIVCRDSLRGEVSAPPWKDLRRALVRMELLGKVRRGFFVQELSGEQYAYPEAVDALREAKLRHPEANGDGAEKQADIHEPMLLLDACDPANPFAGLFPIVNEAGERVKSGRNPHQYLVIQAGQPVCLYRGAITLLADLSRERAEMALRALMGIVDRPPAVATYQQLQVTDWNGHPIDVSPARHLLITLGFVKGKSRQKGLVYDGMSRPDGEAVAQAHLDMPDLYEAAGKERSPVRYDADWIVSRSHPQIRHKVRALIRLLGRILPTECKTVYHPRHFVVQYRGVRCMTPWIQQKQIRLQIAHKGWTPGILIRPDTDLDSAPFMSEVLRQFGETRQQIDASLDLAKR